MYKVGICIIFLVLGKVERLMCLWVYGLFLEELLCFNIYVYDRYCFCIGGFEDVDIDCGDVRVEEFFYYYRDVFVDFFLRFFRSYFVRYS